MSLRRDAVVLDAHDPEKVATFWAAMLGRRRLDDARGGVLLPPTSQPGFAVRIVPGAAPKVAANRTHLDLTSATPQGQADLVATALAHGGKHIDIGQGPDAEHVVLADPEGNELCVIDPGNGFLADTGRIGAVNCDGTQRLGYFWSEALGWPLVWDQDEETAIQSALGGSKVTWSGPPLDPKHGKERLHLDVAPVDADQATEVARLETLGARRTDIGQGDVSWVVMVDPDGNEFCVLDS
ncbi:VOC family protein [Luteipulveratus halotolerans]|uniref:Glyoxalase/bleomycin resistance protein/dioxygenase n=1 Tax=Luteipulveratus halotolerans TaxID=1631356 RepID=A0A0L6CHW1_9MICO|nr:VOC family protein [Luteipulveratus halotolerans]KNX37108.1 glyoxalase/bleomycin resistance protein/dioxygenase [Luteipulveratus halotolerans]